MGTKIQLKEGIITTRALAEWFGVSYSTMKNGRKRKLEELKLFAEFNDLGRKGIEITKVMLPYYEKQGSESRQYMTKHFDEELIEENGVACMSYLGRKMRRKGNLPIAVVTSEKMAREVRKEKMGTPGEKGSKCHLEWGKIDRQQDGKAYLFTEEDKRILKEILAEEAVDISKIAEAFAEFFAGEVSEDKIKKVLDKEFSYNWWLKVCKSFEQRTGYWPSKVTVDDRGKLE